MEGDVANRIKSTCYACVAFSYTYVAIIYSILISWLTFFQYLIFFTLKVNSSCLGTVNWKSFFEHEN